jgi:hypothetical protein
MFTIPSANDLVDFIKDFTGSSNDSEIKKCIFMAEMSMRNIELPALRCDPYSPENIGIADSNGRIPIPGDMNKPILFFKQGQQYLTTAQVSGVDGEDTINIITTPNKSLSVGMTVTGTGIAPGATIVSFPGPNYSVVQLSANNIGTVSGDALFQTSSPGSPSSQTGPWIVYDRIGDRDIITQSMIAQLYLQPVNVPAVIRGKFSEVGAYYEFLPYVAEGDLINMYYYKAWPLLFSPADDELIDTSATVSSSTGTTATLTVNDSSSVSVGDTLMATAGTGDFGTSGTVTVTAVPSSTTITISGTGISDGTVTGVYITDITVQSNAVLATWPEGYVYGSLREYYIKRHNKDDAAVYEAKFNAAMATVEDQNNLGKWSGGHTRLTSVWQPRQYRQYNIK